MEEIREKVYEALEFNLARLILRGEPLPEPTMGPDDVEPGTIAEWMVVRLRLGDAELEDIVVRACPER